jgi:hypothetical protein
MKRQTVDFQVNIQHNDGRSEVKTVQTDFPRWELIKLREQYKGQARVDPVEKKYKV